MKMKVVTAAVLAATAALASSTAHATLQLAFQNGASTFNCADGQVCDLSGPTSNLLVLNQQIGAFHVEGTFAESGAKSLSESNLTITNTSNTSQTLVFAASATGFLGPVHFIGESGSGTFENAIGGSGSLSFHADTANQQGADTATDTPGVLLFNPSTSVLTDPQAFDGNHLSAFLASNPYSMTLDYSITLPAGGSIVGLESAMTAGIPEPRTWAMMAIGFVLTAGLGLKRRQRSARYLV